MVRITGIITFIGSMVLFSILVHEVIEDIDYLEYSLDSIMLQIAALLTAYSGFYYTTKTKFGDSSELIKLEKQSKIIEKKIKYQKLVNEMEELSSKSTQKPNKD